MRLSLVFDRIRWEEKMLEAAARSKGLDLELVDGKDLCLTVHQSKSKLEKLFGGCVLQRCMSHFRGLHLAAYLESKGISVINSRAVSEICGNKLLTSLALVKAGVPTPRTALSFTTESALRAANELGYPVVFKPITGSWGRLVAPMRDHEAAKSILEVRELVTNPMDHIFYLQEMVKRPGRDIRVIVAGEGLVAANYRYAPPGEWRTNVARGGRTEPCEITPQLEEIALRAAQGVGGGVLGVDLMEGPSGLVVHEVNSNVEFRGAASVSKRDIPAAIIDYVLQRARS